ncbi:hypothetical protein [Mesorhizobium sp. M0701]|uniref:hypothetical protein n=1 Tax=Mesorhizobium sp. M0701 TaxID=2956989 RepID=UPI00333C12FF
MELKSLFGNSRNGAVVFEECLDRGLIVEKESRYELSAAGEAIADAKATKRAALSRALKLIDELLDRAAALNADTNGASFIDQVWLFGSTMRAEETVGDIDIALTTSRRPPFDADWNAMKAHVKRLLLAHKDVPRVLWNEENWLIERALFGKRRHPLFAGVRVGISDLQQLGVPCRLIFDRERGGRVDDNILARHPNSPGRSKEIDPPRPLPDLAPAPLRPMDGRWAANHQPWGTISPYHIFGSWNDAAHGLFASYPEGLRVVGDGHCLFKIEWTPKRLQHVGLDGRAKVAIFKQSWWGGLSLVLCREIIVGDEVQLIASFEALQLLRVRSQVWGLLDDVASAIALILAADAERIIRREMEQGRTRQVRISLNGAELKETIRGQVLATVGDRLVERRVKIEPEGWNGQPVQISTSELCAA